MNVCVFYAVAFAAVATVCLSGIPAALAAKDPSLVGAEFSRRRMHEGKHCHVNFQPVALMNQWETVDFCPDVHGAHKTYAGGDLQGKPTIEGPGKSDDAYWHHSHYDEPGKGTQFARFHECREKCEDDHSCKLFHYYGDGSCCLVRNIEDPKIRRVVPLDKVGLQFRKLDCFSNFRNENNCPVKACTPGTATCMMHYEPRDPSMDLMGSPSPLLDQIDLVTRCVPRDSAIAQKRRQNAAEYSRQAFIRLQGNSYGAPQGALAAEKEACLSKVASEISTDNCAFARNELNPEVLLNNRFQHPTVNIYGKLFTNFGDEKPHMISHYHKDGRLRYPVCNGQDMVVDYKGGFHHSGYALFDGYDNNHNTELTVDSQAVVADPLDACMGLDSDDGGRPADTLTGNFADGSMQGKIVIAQRGACYFTTKVINAQNAGAKAVIIYNSAGSEGTITMGGPDVGITIPVVFIEEPHGDKLVEAVTEDPETIVSLHCEFTTLR